MHIGEELFAIFIDMVMIGFFFSRESLPRGTLGSQKNH